MKICPNCRNQMADDALYCPVCGAAVTINQPAAPSYMEPPAFIAPVPKADPYNHTEKFSKADIYDHKLLCMLVYLLDVVGMIIALLAAKESEYTAFHMRQAMKYTVLEALISIAAALLSWTFIVPILALVAMIILIVLKLISFAQVCKGQAKEPAIIRSIKFLN
ncbi:MAG: zinc-ribbon domain-containing protein [Oscillospiraceae bacterium]|nr:zinc-ribbon domain-containing protein [Oscillospiraceae bacterium]